VRRCTPVLLLVLLLAVAVPAALAASHVYVLQGGSPYGHAYKPHRVQVSGDGSFFITGMHWGSYSSTRATGHGTGHVDDCIPTCAGGTLHKVKVSVRLSAPRRCRNGARYFTHQRFTFNGARPSGLPRREAFNVRSC
jgi:hypothetical protein